MGYYTQYSLEWSPKTLDLDAVIAEAIIANEGMHFCLNPDGTSDDTAKWYDHEEDLRALSKQLPLVLLTLSGKGEEAGDLWKKYFLGGKMQVAKVKLDYPLFNVNLLS